MKKKLHNFFLLNDSGVITILLCLLLLWPSAIKSQSFNFIHISDVHISDGSFNIGNYDENGEQFFCNLKEFNYLNPKPAFVVVSGDVSNIGSKSPDGMYPAIIQYLYPQGGIVNPDNGAYFIDQEQTIPIYFVSGNHEYYESWLLALDQTSVLAYYPMYIAPDVDYAITHNGAQILFLRTGSDCSLVEDPEDGIGITNAQCQWLRSTLNPTGGTPTNNRKIIVMHHPGAHAAGTEIDGSPNSENVTNPATGSFIENRETFLNICDSNNVDVILSGHKHQFVVADRYGNVVLENWTGGTRYCQTAQCFGGAYRIITVDSNFVYISTPRVVDCMSAGKELLSVADFKIYPNPFSDYAVLQLAGSEDDIVYKLRIYDVTGREVGSKADIVKGKNMIQRDGLAPGIYFYSLISPDNSTISSRKVIIKD
ncbi:MAG: metallophosphoesterase [Bacteroidales bacterium]|nr:metallophosphoesterase [Bacteroidales bacterium]